MHAHDRTLLASLGFADPDKRNPLHDFACQYLALRENHERLAGMVAPLDAPNASVVEGSAFKFSPEGVYQERFRFVETQSMELRKPTLEFPISKGEGKYKTSVGFVDVVLPHVNKIVRRGVLFEVSGGARANERDHVAEIERRVTVYVEVKIGRASAAEVLRQIGLYREHVPSFDDDGVPGPGRGAERVLQTFRWLLATPYTIDRTDKATLEGAGIRHILLGEKFQRWAAERQSAPVLAESPEL